MNVGNVGSDPTTTLYFKKAGIQIWQIESN